MGSRKRHRAGSRRQAPDYALSPASCCEERLNDADAKGFVSIGRFIRREPAGVFHYKDCVYDKVEADRRTEEDDRARCKFLKSPSTPQLAAVAVLEAIPEYPRVGVLPQHSTCRWMLPDRLVQKARQEIHPSPALKDVGRRFPFSPERETPSAERPILRHIAAGIAKELSPMITSVPRLVRFATRVVLVPRMRELHNELRRGSSVDHRRRLDLLPRG